MSDPQQLLQQTSQQLWSLLRELREELKADRTLADLAPLPGLESTPLAGLLQPVDNLSPTSGGAALFNLARTLISSGSAEGSPFVFMDGTPAVGNHVAWHYVPVG